MTSSGKQLQWSPQPHGAATTVPARPAIVRTAICPHCWAAFPPSSVLWVAAHPELIGDALLGPEQPQRFLPSRFNVPGLAIDARGQVCHELACPQCHLRLPRPLVEMPPLFLSILGAPASGKSYFLASLTWRLRSVLPQRFRLEFQDADPICNLRLHEYESLQFLNPNPDALVALEKTQTHGDLYETVLRGGQPVTYPKPFLFTLAPREDHPRFAERWRFGRCLCLYDNAGESFLPGQDTSSSPVTRHLAQSQALFFLFDPTQDPRFRQACLDFSGDPQMRPRTERLQREQPIRQETVLLEAAARVRRYVGLPHSSRHARPLFIIVTKLDAWQKLLGPEPLPAIYSSAGNGIYTRRVDELSTRLRTLLQQYAPEVVAAAESFAEQVVYIPVSATGCGPEVDERTGALGFRPRNLRPVWAETPLLYALTRCTPQLLPALRTKNDSSSSKLPTE